MSGLLDADELLQRTPAHPVESGSGSGAALEPAVPGGRSRGPNHGDHAHAEPAQAAFHQERPVGVRGSTQAAAATGARRYRRLHRDPAPGTEGFDPPISWLGPSCEEVRWAHYCDGGGPWAGQANASAPVGPPRSAGTALGCGLPPLAGLAFTMGAQPEVFRGVGCTQRGGAAGRPARTPGMAAALPRPRRRSGVWPWRSVGRRCVLGASSDYRVLV